MVIAIDGPGGVGKSTVARRVAQGLGLAYLDSGAFYRAVALAVIRAGVDPSDSPQVVDVVSRTGLEFDDGGMLLDGEVVAAEIRTERVTMTSSQIAVLPDVRDHVNAALRAWAERHAGRAVVEGRDIGSIVFPDAHLKVFLDARPEIRTARRAADPAAEQRDRAAVSAALERRDRRDATRQVAPLKAAEDAAVIDTSDLGIDQVVARVIELASDPAR